VELKDIKAIIDLMKKNSVSEFELEKQDFKIRLKRGMTANNIGAVQYEEVPALAYASSSPTAAATNASSPPAPAPATPSNELEIKSPMIGTFYRSPSPESAPYIEIGTEVGPDTVVCIIEAMKVMNEIKGEVRGVVTQILMENAKPVEFGQPMFRVKPI
jgi:acetyl-CoA carboxylase biotin carboxyl carrier protein